MAKRTWKDGDHHIIPKENWTTDLEEHLFDDMTIHLSGEDHVQIHRDEREVGPYGSLTRHAKRKLMQGK